MYTTSVSRTLTVTMTLDALGGVTLDFREPESGEESRLELWGPNFCFDSYDDNHNRNRVGAEIAAYVRDMEQDLKNKVGEKYGKGN